MHVAVTYEEIETGRGRVDLCKIYLIASRLHIIWFKFKVEVEDSIGISHPGERGRKELRQSLVISLHLAQIRSQIHWNTALTYITPRSD